MAVKNNLINNSCQEGLLQEIKTPSKSSFHPYNNNFPLPPCVAFNVILCILKNPLLFISNKIMKTLWESEGIFTMAVRGLNAWESSAGKWNRTSKSETNMKPIFSKSDTGCSRMVRSSSCWSVKPGKSAALLAYTNEKDQDDFRDETLFVWHCYYAGRVVIFPVKFHCELTFIHPWLSCKYSGTFEIKKRTAINYCSEIERPLQRIKISAAVPASIYGVYGVYETSVVSGSHSRREAHYSMLYPLQHLMQRITRDYRDNMPTSPKRSTYLDIQTLPRLNLRDGSYTYRYIALTKFDFFPNS
jgi:hypothetical protein